MASDRISAGISVSIVPVSQAANSSTTTNLGGKSLPPGGKLAGDPGAASAAPAAETSTVSRAAASATGSAAHAAGQARAVTSTTASAAPKATAAVTPKLDTLVAQLNKHLNDSGRATQFRIQPGSGDRIIQEINPANGAVIGAFPASEFPALARSVGLSGALVDSHA